VSDQAPREENCIIVECTCGQDFAVYKHGDNSEKWGGLNDVPPAGMARYWHCPNCWRKWHASLIALRAHKDVVRDESRV